MVEWLEDYLKKGNITILMVTHDRYFLERVCNQIIELDLGKLYKYSGNYADYLEKRRCALKQKEPSGKKIKNYCSVN